MYELCIWLYIETPCSLRVKAHGAEMLTGLEIHQDGVKKANFQQEWSAMALIKNDGLIGRKICNYLVVHFERGKIPIFDGVVKRTLQHKACLNFSCVFKTRLA